MIYWTPLDLEQVLEGWDRMNLNLVEIEYDGLLLQVEPLGDGKGKVVRLISSNPTDFLRPDLLPGRVIPMFTT